MSRDHDRRRHGGRRRGDATPIWARPAPGERKPAHSRDRIAETALLIADAEGFEAVTMRRIATELGAGTMTLYHYVRNKDELAALMDDAIMSELLVPDDELAEGWREGMAQIARRSYEAFQRHPWVFDLVTGEGAPPQSGPNALRHVEQSLAVAARTGLDFQEQLELVALVDDYVFGHAMRARETRAHQSVEDAEERLERLIAYLESQLQTGEYPILAAWAGDDVRAGFIRIAEMSSDPGRFERGLQRLLDGIELWIRG
jgi:AcrR family transcriptional regulator